MQLLFECTPPARLLKAGRLALNGPPNGLGNGHANGVLSNGTEVASEQQQHEKCSAEDKHVKQLCELQSASQEELERYLEPRHVIDVLTDFAFPRLPLEKLLRSLRPLQPRLYSISSSPLEAPRRVQVLHHPNQLNPCSGLEHLTFVPSNMCIGSVHSQAPSHLAETGLEPVNLKSSQRVIDGHRQRS